ncbi:MAG: heme o synthase [Roseovarius sp.]|nr:heme o synthase [Roseovarius sp.]
MWWDADIDRVMRRTQSRPIPAGRITEAEAFGFGMALAGFAVILLWLATNALAAALLAFTIFFYVVVYSMWLKRWTPQNIVIGGAAGAFPPMIGWAAATGGIGIEAVLMFALIFMWTPPHFWALALFMKTDYHDAGVPMLTVTHGRKVTRAHILVYTVLLAGLALGRALPRWAGRSTWPWRWFSTCFSSVAPGRSGGATRPGQRRMATASRSGSSAISLFYLFGHFGAIALDTATAPLWVGVW